MAVVLTVLEMVVEEAVVVQVVLEAQEELVDHMATKELQELQETQEPVAAQEAQEQTETILMVVEVPEDLVV